MRNFLVCCRLGLLFAVLGLGSCGNPPQDSCLVITIDDANYFDADRVLINQCTGVDYIIKGNNFLNVRGALTIEAGVTVEFENNGGLNIQSAGSIRALGTSGEPIVLRGSEGATGDWRGLIVFSGNSTNTLQYTTISGGGSDAFNSNDDKGNLILYAGSKMAVDHCTFEKGASYGVNANYRDVDLLSFTNNTIQNNQAAMLACPEFAHSIESSNRFPNNINNYVLLNIGGIDNVDRTWQALDVPYRQRALSGVFFDLGVVNGGTLTLEPGVVMEFEANTGIDVKSGSALIARGTATQPIQFIGATAVAGFWDGIYFNNTQNPLNELTHVDISYAGGDSDIGAISMWASSNLTLSEVRLRNISGGCAIYDSRGLSGGLPSNPNYSASNVTFENVGSEYCD